MSAGRAGGRRRAVEHEEEEHENHERWLVSFADMMTLLTAVFIVLYSISQVDQQKFAALASGLSEGFGAPTSVLVSGSPTRDPDILEGLPEPVVTTTDVNQTGQGEQAGVQVDQAAVEQVTVDQAAAEAAAQHNAQVRAEAQAAFDQLTAARQAIDDALTAAGRPDAVDFQIDERGLTAHIVADEVLFGPERAVLRPEGAALLDILAAPLTQLPNELRIEGHTNSIPVSAGGPFPSNWELSTGRSTTVLRYLAERGGVPELRLSAAGFAATRPLVPDSDPASVSANRRVDIVILSAASTEARAQLPGLAAQEARQTIPLTSPATAQENTP